MNDQKMDTKRLVSLIASEFQTAVGVPGGDISNERARALKRFLREPYGDEEEGESRATTSDVADVVNSLMPSLLRQFTGSDNIANFRPSSIEDVESAQQQSDYVNHVFFNENDAFLFTYNWFFDALLQKLGVAIARWDEREEISEEEYNGLDAFDLAKLDEDPELEAIDKEQREEPDTGPDGLPISDEMGNPVMRTLYDVRYRRVHKIESVRVENVPPDQYRISSEHGSLNPAGARMVGWERTISRSDLIDMGFDPDQVKELPGQDYRTGSQEESARKNKSDDRNGNAMDKSQESILVREAYIRVDFDGDGRAELRQVFTGGGQLLRWKHGEDANEIVSRQPFHVLCPYPIPHKHIGQSAADLVVNEQDVTTALLRQVLMNLYHSNNPSHDVWELGMTEDTMEDLLNSRVGSINRFSRPPAEAHSVSHIPFTAGQTFPMLEYFEKVKRDRTGTSSDSDGLDPESLKNIQISVLANANDLSLMKVETVARIFAETGFKTLFLHINELLMRYQKRERIVELRNKWVRVDPRNWVRRYHMKINVGLGVGSRERNLMHLGAIWDKQIQVWEGGGKNVMVTPRNLHHTLTEIVKNANFAIPDEFFTDPGDQPLAEEGPDIQVQMLQAQLQLQQSQQQIDAERARIQEMRAKIDAERMLLQHQRDLAKLEEQKESREDKLAVEMERLQNQVAEMRMKVLDKEADRQLEREIADADIAKTKAETQKIERE